MNKPNVKKDEYKDDEYKDDNSQAPKSDEGVINKTEEEEELTDCLMSKKFLIKVVNNVIGSISLCEQKSIKFVKNPNQRYMGIL